MKKIRVGFVIDKIRPYNKIMASTRIRVYDIIDAFKKEKKYQVEIYKIKNKYDILIFQKYFFGEAFEIAKREKEKGAKIILDINVNYYNKESDDISFKLFEDICKFTNISDGVITASNYLKDFVKEIFPHKEIVTIEENINKKYFKKCKKIFNKEVKFIWSGYSPKIKDLLFIKNILSSLAENYNIELIVISNSWEEISINGVKIKFVRYNEKKIVKQLLEGDIFLAPRDLLRDYNLGHTFTKIGVAMALGIPVIASAVPSYLESPAVICKKDSDWYNCFLSILNNNFDLRGKSKDGIKYCLDNYGIDKIRNDYLNFFKKIIENS